MSFIMNIGVMLKRLVVSLPCHQSLELELGEHENRN